MFQLLRLLHRACLFLCLAGLVPAAMAQSYPDKTVKLVVPFPAGATMDFVVRLIAQKLSDDWGQPVVVENRTGGAGLIGTNFVAKAPADGYTILAVANSFAANPTLRSDLPYDTARDFAPITLIGSTPLVLVAHSGLPVKNTAELVAMAKSQPGRIPYGAAGGASPHMAMAWFESVSGAKLQFVPYRGQSQAQTDLLSGQVKLVFGNLPDVLPYVKSGHIKALGIATHARSPLAPEIPTLAEAGYKGPEWDSWYGFLAPAGTPRAVIDKFSAGVSKVLSRPDVKQQLTQTGLLPVGNSPAQFANFLKTTGEDYAKIIKQAGIRAE
ncbi:MAG: tripartite tricarboxylate transporter substrate binding protein [Burkholderiaceae bacterium]|nr:tripartite tricarboxylate transporter substrate binding protein [Burkholderiaceae bacterium]